ncbi:MAG: zf-HC2 domain-containing protein [bacterium]|nr:zf-HC2 domain-containing protein [bacterium]
MKKTNTSISCNVCQDLIPLVLDEVASKDSVELVNQHLATCESCRNYYGNFPMQEAANLYPDDDRTVKKMKKALSLGLLAFLLIGGLLGIVLTDGENVFYNSIIMPIVGSLCYLVCHKRWYFPCLGLMGITYLWIFITSWIEEGYSEYLFMMPVFYTFVYGILLIVGVTIAYLLTYAFRKEKMV